MNPLVKYFLFLLFASFSFMSCSERELTSKEIHDKKYPLEVDPDAYVFKEGEKIHWKIHYEAEMVLISFTLISGWKTYSCFNENIFGPLPTYITFEPSEDYELIDKINESLVKKKYDKEAEEELLYFEHTGLFVQKIKPKTNEKFLLKGKVNYMLCNDVGCDPPVDFEFEIEIKANKGI